MEPNLESPETQQTPEVIEVSKAELDELRKKADVSSQNFERLKKLEQEKKELEAKLTTDGGTTFDPSQLERKVEEKVDLRLKGYTSEQIGEIEKYAKGAGISLSEAEKSPFIQSAVEAIRAKEKSVQNTPASSSRIPVFNGKPATEGLKSESLSDRQAAFDAMRSQRKVKGNE